MNTRTSMRKCGIAGVVAMLCVVCPGAFGATVALGSGTIYAGFSETSLALTLESAVGEQVAGIQCLLVYDCDVLSISGIEQGPAAVAASKSVSYSELEPGVVVVLITGLNMNAMSSGTVAIVTFEASRNAPDGDQVVALEEVILANPYGVAVSCSPVSGVLTVDGASLPVVEPGLKALFVCGIVLVAGILCIGRRGRTRWISCILKR